jgi:hypothetical protein
VLEFLLVAFDTFDPAGHRLIDERLLNAVPVLMPPPPFWDPF